MKNAYDTIISLLTGREIPFAVLSLEGSCRAVVTQRWGRILGPFREDGSSFMWLNDSVWSSSAAFDAAFDQGLWNVGGERFWLAPEIRLNIRDRYRFWETYELPKAMDPGSWTLNATESEARLFQDLELPLHCPESGLIRVRAERLVRPAANPLRSLRSYDSLMEGVVYSGYEHSVDLRLLQGSVEDGACETWTLCQLVPRGTIYVPCTAEGFEYEDYYEKTDGSCLRLLDGMAAFSVTGDRRYKVGLRAPALFGRAGYLKETAAGAELMVRSFPNDPSSEYVEEPGSLEGCRGLSFHVYNDGGVFGGFGELECNGRTLGGRTGRRESRDDFSFWWFRGNSAAVRRIAALLLGPAAASARPLW